MRLRNKNTNGFSLVEIVVGLSILAIAFVTLFGTFRLYLRAALKTTETLKAAYLLEEGVEAVKIIRDSGFTANIAPLAPGTLYYVAWESGTWKVTTIPQTIDGFVRSFTASSVYRDGNQDIAATGSLDDNTKKVDMSVAWLSHGATSTQVISTYITDLLSN